MVRLGSWDPGCARVERFSISSDEVEFVGLPGIGSPQAAEVKGAKSGGRRFCMPRVSGGAEALRPAGGRLFAIHGEEGKLRGKI